LNYILLQINFKHFKRKHGSVILRVAAIAAGIVKKQAPVDKSKKQIEKMAGAELDF